MTEKELIEKLKQLQNMQSENEIVEFKEAKNTFEFDKIGKYFSALANEANLKNTSCAWLIFGVENKNHNIVGTQYKNNENELNLLKKKLADKINNRISFIEIYTLVLPEGRVIMFQIPPAPQGLPISFDGHFYGRDHESLVSLNIEELERIRRQSNLQDWTSEIVNGASLNDLDPEAIKKARLEFVKRNPSKIDDEKTWDDTKFLDKAKLTINGQITKTSLILLGRDESEHYLGSSVKIRWILRDMQDQNLASEVYSIPFILNVDKVFNAIRNLKYIYTKEDTVFPEEMPRYDVFTIREPLHNAIAHQDYLMNGYINVVEYQDDHLIFSNLGKFLPSSVEDVVLKDTPQESYRNPFLVAAMKNLNMIETEGGGIRKIFNFQRLRLFPMPDYDISDNKCKITIIGKVLNMDFARILIKNPGLSLVDILLLDKVQKNRKDLSEEQISYLRKKNFIEGRKPNFYLSFKVIQPLDNDNLYAEYIVNKALTDDYCKKLILDYLKTHGQTSKSKIESFIIPKLLPIMTENQKKGKVKNLLTSLRKSGEIESIEGYLWKIKI
jgi:ATP-dependent DNA helicase RecG